MQRLYKIIEDKKLLYAEFWLNGEDYILKYPTNKVGEQFIFEKL